MKQVLFIDGMDLLGIRELLMLTRDKQVMVITEGDLGNPSEYKITEGFYGRLQDCIANNSFDLIILGNNRGWGVAKGTAIPPDSRCKTIVVSNSDLDPADRRPYEDGGYSQFMTRRKLSEVLREKLGIHP